MSLRVKQVVRSAKVLNGYDISMFTRRSRVASIKIPQGYSLGYELIGGAEDAPPVVLLNGSLFNYRQWDLLLRCGFKPKLPGNTRILRYDYGGTGRSLRRGVVPWSIDALVEELKALLDALGLDRVHLYGLSKGTIVAQAFGAAYPDRVISLAGYGWFHLDYSRMKGVAQFFGERLKHFDHLGWRDPLPLEYAEFKTLWQEVYDFVITHRRLGMHTRVPGWIHALFGALLKRKVYRLLEPTPARVMYDWFAYALQMMPEAGDNFRPSYAVLRGIPTLIQHARYDGTLPLGMAEELHALLPLSQLVEYPKGYNHISVTINPRQAAQLVKGYAEFLAERFPFS